MVTLEIKRDGRGIYRFYLKNSGSYPVSDVRIINNALKCRFIDRTYHSAEGTHEYFLNFSEKPSLNAGEECEINPELNIVERGGLCPVGNIEIRPPQGSYDTLAQITISYKIDGQDSETKMRVSWSRRYEILENPDLNAMVFSSKPSLVRKIPAHSIMIGLVVTVVGGLILMNLPQGCSRFEKLCPSTNLDISQLADRALWEGTNECGDRSVYNELQRCYEEIKDFGLRAEYANQINRIKNDYKTSILGPRAKATRSVCREGTMNGDRCVIEPEKGFSAKNVIDHLDQSKYPRCTSRLRAAALLQNIDTSKGKKDMKKAIRLLVFILENDPSLLVSKLALDRYSQFTGYSPLDVFDFDDALKDWDKRKIEILKEIKK